MISLFFSEQSAMIRFQERDRVRFVANHGLCLSCEQLRRRNPASSQQRVSAALVTLSNLSHEKRS